MSIKDKIELITNHLMLEKKRNELELERFVNSDIPLEDLCSNITTKLNDYRNSINNVTLWLDFIGPINNNPEEGENKNK